MSRGHHRQRVLGLPKIPRHRAQVAGCWTVTFASRRVPPSRYRLSRHGNGLLESGQKGQIRYAPPFEPFNFNSTRSAF